MVDQKHIHLVYTMQPASGHGYIESPAAGVISLK